MRESKYQLSNWKKWKYKIKLLEETRDELKDMRRAIPIGSEEMPGGSHKSIINKMSRIVELCDEYDILINDYKFLVRRLESAIATLDDDKRKVCIIYSNYPNNSCKREMEALERGLSRATFYRLLDSVYIELDELLEINKSNVMTINDYDREIY